MLEYRTNIQYLFPLITFLIISRVILVQNDTDYGIKCLCIVS